jgi:hypothetical protein
MTPEEKRLNIARTVVSTTWPLRSQQRLLENFKKAGGDGSEDETRLALQQALVELNTRTA